jgi:acetylornithine deacetylase/succinyl-diaminopimelate desuccinylase-like protein
LSTFTTDEEVGGYTGVNYLVDQHVITKNIDYCLSTDAGIEALHVASLGDAEFLLTVHGKPAHSGRGWTGVNAIEYGALLISELNKLGREVGARRSNVDAEPVYGIKKMRPGVYCTVAKGGLKGNIIPDTFEILVDRRSIPEEKPNQIQSEIANVVKNFQSKHPQVKVSMKKILGYAPMVTRPDHPLVKTVRHIAKNVLGQDVRPCGSQGSTDMAIVSELGIPVTVLGASRNDSNVHGIDEHVRIRDLVSVTKVLAHSYLELDRMGR